MTDIMWVFVRPERPSVCLSVQQMYFQFLLKHKNIIPNGPDPKTMAIICDIFCEKFIIAQSVSERVSMLN